MFHSLFGQIMLQVPMVGSPLACMHSSPWKLSGAPCLTANPGFAPVSAALVQGRGAMVVERQQARVWP